MSCGKPILCGDICDNSMIVKDHINGFLFNPNRVEDIVDKMDFNLL
jgi:glycosyltransferase involved in cell wall biosynthesis